MSDNIKEKAEEIAEEVEETILEAAENPSEIEAQIVAAKAEAAVQRAEDAANTLEMAAAIQVANITQQAEQQIVEHEEKVEELEYDQKWQLEMIKSLQTSMQNLESQVQILASNLQTPTPSMDNQLPQTVEIVEQLNADGADQAGQNPVAEIIETADQVQEKIKRKIRAL